MSIASRRYRKMRRFVEKMKVWEFSEVKGMLLVDTDPAVVKAAIDEGYFDVADPLDLEVRVDSRYNDYSIFYEGLGKTAVQAKRVAVGLFAEVAFAWRERIRREFQDRTWNIYIRDEKSDPAFPGLACRGVLTIYFFNRLVWPESAELVIHSSNA